VVGSLEQMLGRQPGSKTVPPSGRERHACHRCQRESFVLA
jgi:hypothetical protein